MTTEAVYNFMKCQNRPYNINDIVSHLPNEKSKTAVQQAVDKLVKANKLFDKVYGKQKIYCVVQESKHNSADLSRINSELQAHANELELKRRELENEIKIREDKLSALKTGPTLDEAVKETTLIQDRIRELEKRLDHLIERSGSLQNSGENKRKAEKMCEQYSREYSKRKRICNDIIDGILEGFPGTKKQLYDDIGIVEKIVK